MRLTILRMLSTNSLSAFSVSAAQQRAPMSSAAATAGVQRVSNARSPSTQAQPAQTLRAGPMPSQALPRGSLLDLSV
jgi:hypothetical protein